MHSSKRFLNLSSPKIKMNLERFNTKTPNHGDTKMEEDLSKANRWYLTYNKQYPIAISL